MVKKIIKKVAGATNQIHNKVREGTKAVLDKTSVDDKFISGVKRVRKEYKKNLVTALSAGLAFIIALYVRDVLKAWIELALNYFKLGDATSLFYQSIVALFVVGLCVLGIIFLGIWEVKKEEKK